ncbi:hypothetical protein CPB84DRAFT_1850531 [Gymnopilus junonius]|uniref:Uncharacterized protein n=1 Tax=Gymnopilus junonius TaxID=109634 RepID=A0A9P5NI48_GYMJU|nr:hypothetical protein CPB84DRAFT_1850531 [Gymnopilus junonius]
MTYSNYPSTSIQAPFLLLRKLFKPVGPLLLRPETTASGADCEQDKTMGGKEMVQSPRPDDEPSASTTILGAPFFSRSSPRRSSTLSTLLPLYVKGRPALPDVSDSDRHSLSTPDNSSVTRGGHMRHESGDTVVTPSTTTGEPLPEEKADIHDHGRRRGLSDEVEDLVAVTSDEYQRYERNQTTQKYHWDEYIIDPLETDFTRPEPQNEWKLHVHPEGFIYFHNESREIPILTDVYVFDGSALERLEGYIEGIFGYIRKTSIELPTDICLVLESRNSRRYGYYFVDHTAQCLFWLDEFDAVDFLTPVRVEYTPSLVYHEMKALYWLHNEYFSDMRPFPEAAVLELKDTILHAIGDSLTSPSSTAPYTIDTLTKMLEVVEKIEALKSGSPKSVSIIYRFLHNFCHEKFLQLHGERYARLNAEQSIHPERPKTILMKLLSPLLLYGPEVHLRKLKEISVDLLVKGHRWTSFLQEVTDEWKEFTLYATVLLNANVAFLAIQSVDGSAPPHSRSAMQRASYFSIITSIGTIILGLLLVRQHNTTLNSSFLANRSASILGLETLALMYSLPYALLLWGFVSFLAAFSLMCFSSHDVLTIIMITISGAVLLSLLFWSISVSFEKKPFWYPWLFRRFQSIIQTEGIRAGSGRLKPRTVPASRMLSKSATESTIVERS